MTGIWTVRVAEIVVGDRWRRHASPIPKLASDAPPVILTPEKALISGWRRLCSAREFGVPELRAVTVTTIEDVVPYWNEERDGAIPMRFTDLMRLMDVLCALQQPTLRERNVRQILAARNGKPFDRASYRMADLLGMFGEWSNSTVSRARPLWKTLKDGMHPQSHLLTEIDEGRLAIATAYRSVNIPVKKRHRFNLPSTPPSRVLASREDQINIVTRAAIGLRGYTVALGEVSPVIAEQFTPEEADKVSAAIVAFQRRINPLLRALNAVAQGKDTP